MSFDRIARYYRWLEYFSFGPGLQRRRTCFYDAIEPPETVLMLGEGDGRSMTPLSQMWPQAQIDYLDKSETMMRLAQSRCSGKVTFRRADARDAALAPHAYDLVVTHFFLDCFRQDEVDGIVARVAQAAKPKAQWIVSEFRESNAVAAHFVIPALYGFFRYTAGLQTGKLPDYAASVERQGFQLTAEKTAWAGMLCSQLWSRR